MRLDENFGKKNFEFFEKNFFFQQKKISKKFFAVLDKGHPYLSIPPG